MQPSKQSIFQVFQQERRYVVPLFQRAYVWTQDLQWQPLWEDVERQARIREDDSVAPSLGGQGSNHFLGAVVLQVDQIVGGRIAKTSVIDGQQRLTTFQVMLRAIRDYLHEIEHDYVGRFDRLTQNPDCDPNDEDYFKVWPTNADRKTFLSVMTGGSPAGVRERFGVTRPITAGLPQLALAYLFFREAFKAYVEGEDESRSDATVTRDRRIAAVHLALQSALLVVVIELEASDDPQIIFETLNARGQALLPSDLIKNSVFLEAGGGQQAEQWYDRHWKKFDTEISPEEPEKRFWHATNGLVRPARPQVDVFFYTFLVERTARDVNVGQLYSEFKHWRNSDRDLVTKQLLELIDARSEIFKKVVVGGLNARIDEFFERLRSLDTISPVPVVLHLLSRLGETRGVLEISECVADIESFLVRRLFSGKSSKNYGTYFIGLLKSLKSVEDAALSKALRKYLLTAPGAGDRPWPDDATFEAGWLEHKIYVKSRSDRAAMVLRALEKSLYNNLTEPPPSLRQLSVEHLLPQAGNLATYPYGKAEVFLEYPPEERRDRLLHTMGNLTLLTQPLNALIGNGNFGQKATHISNNSNLRLNRVVHGATAWDEADIVKRGRDLFKQAKLIWPKPSL